MKSTKKETVCRVSDRAYRIIISDVIDSMTGCKIDPFTFKQVVTAVRHYLKPEGKPTGLGRKPKFSLDFLPVLRNPLLALQAGHCPQTLYRLGIRSRTEIFSMRSAAKK